MRVVVIEDCHPIARQIFDKLALCLSYPVDRLKKLEMDRIDVRHDPNVGLSDLAKPGNFSGSRHAQFKDCHLLFFLQLED